MAFGRRPRTFNAPVCFLRLASACLFMALALGGACGGETDLLLHPRERDLEPAAGSRLIARIVHLSDTHIVDAESPARVPGAHVVIPSAWRAWESASAHLTDGIIRATNRMHAAGESIDMVVHTGDACDNSQHNELRWFLEVMDGGTVRRLSGPDDRDPGVLPAPHLDLYAPFAAQGLYRSGVHGPLASIPWYVAAGNHDVLAMGVFPIVTTRDGSRVAPLTLSGRPGWVLPAVLDPVGVLSYGVISPAFPGPLTLLQVPVVITPDAERAYFSRQEFVEAMFGTLTGPAGHGFVHPEGPIWYGTTPVSGLRLITLDTSDIPVPVPGLPYSEGCISAAQRDFLVAELDAAAAAGERVILATHHPSSTLQPSYGSALDAAGLQELLNTYPQVVLHLAGHSHRNRVSDRGGYLEIETCSTLDLPQEARVVELWEQPDGGTLVRYRMFSEPDESLPALGDDPSRELRDWARDTARGRKGETVARDLAEVPNAPGEPRDRAGTWLQPR